MLEQLGQRCESSLLDAATVPMPYLELPARSQDRVVQDRVRVEPARCGARKPGYFACGAKCERQLAHRQQLCRHELCLSTRPTRSRTNYVCTSSFTHFTESASASESSFEDDGRTTNAPASYSSLRSSFSASVLEQSRLHHLNHVK